MIDVIRGATIVGAGLLGMEDRLGQIRNGFIADAIAVDSDPLADPEVLSQPERHLRLVMRNGVVRRRRGVPDADMRALEPRVAGIR